MSTLGKILAVIPARAGSKGVPNKNLRLLNGKPLVAFAIENALRSEWISNVVVTTDSEEVGVIAQRLGASVHWRAKELCGDDVTLDSVVLDAVPKATHWDCVVTMQPTSPTLKAETLDAALTQFFDTRCDTLISVINAPHLSWGREGDKCIPLYQERLNRQYLPDHYMETGAFVMSSGRMIAQGKRIGGAVDVFEISQQESVDIDTFADLALAAFMLRSRKVAIVVNGNKQRGMGHVYRALELADEFYVKPDLIFDTKQTDVRLFGETTHRLIGVEGDAGLFDHFGLQSYDVIINDILSTTDQYMDSLRALQPNAAFVNFEDDGSGALKANLVINALFEEGNLSNGLYGEDYYIAPKLFLFYEPIVVKDEVKKVFVSFGGSDPMNYSGRILDLIAQEIFDDVEFVVVLGRGKEDASDLMKRFEGRRNVHLYYDVRNMPELMSDCDAAIASRGRTCYELALLGVPTIAMSQNVNEEGHNFISEDNGFVYIGTNPSDYQISSTLKMVIGMPVEDRREMQDKMLAHDLRNGRVRVINQINAL